MMDIEGQFSSSTCERQLQYFKAQVSFDHIKEKAGKYFIEYTPQGCGYSAITRHYCKYANGMRKVVYYFHVITIVYYLS